LNLGSHIDDSKGTADAKFELTATISDHPDRAGPGFNFLSFSNTSSPAFATTDHTIGSIGTSDNGDEVAYSFQNSLGGLATTTTTAGPHTVTIALDLTPTYYNGTTQFGQITLTDTVAGSLGSTILTEEESFAAISLIIDGTFVNRTGTKFEALTLTQSAATVTASTTFLGSVSDPENNPLTVAWTVESKPEGSEVLFGDESSPTTGATFSALGTYTLRLTATDNWGASDSEDFTVTVVSAETQVVSVNASDGAASETGPDAGQWTISRTGSTESSLDVYYTLTGTASPSDYTITSGSSVTIPADQSSTTITVTPIDDQDVEDDETVILTIDTDVAYVITTPSATVTIMDNDTGSPTVTTNYSVPHSWLSGINATWANDYEAAVLTDHDGDGTPTYLEYWSGTDPEDPNSKPGIDSIVINGTTVELHWRHAEVDPAIPDVVIESSPDLTPDSWSEVGTQTPANGNNMWSETMPDDKAFYRLATPNTP
jgi:hypothetical protein